MLQVNNYSADGCRQSNLELPDHAINVILGRNHSGKTALCRLIAGLTTSVSGLVILDGKPLTGKQRPVSMVYQTFVNYPNWSVARNIASPMIARGASKKDMTEKVEEISTLLGINHLLTRMPQEISGGQQQRLAIARALVKEPEVLVMDEPFVNLDFKLREQLNLELRSLVAKTGVCLVLTTSDPREAITLADQLILMRAGEIEQSGDALTLYTQPATFAAADLLSDPGINQMGTEEFVRPEHVEIEPCDGIKIPARIHGYETNGAETYLRAEVSTMDESIHQWVVKLPGLHHPPTGDMPLYVREDDVLRFKAG